MTKETKQISLGYKPRQWQKDIHQDKRRWKVIVCHRRAGKTNMAVIELIRGALKSKGSRFAYLAPTYKQAKNVAWDMLKQYARNIPGTKFNEAELRCDLPNGSRVSLYGADNPDSLRGIALWGVVFDEYSQQPSNIYGEIIRPALSDNKGWAIWIGTPKGKNAFYDLYHYAKSDDEWMDYVLQASTSGVLDQEELEDAWKTMTEEEYYQEYECSFNAAIRGAYYAKELALADNEGRIKKGIYEPMLPVYTFWDIGMHDYTAIIFAQIHGNDIRIIDCYHNNNHALDHYAYIIRQKKYDYACHYLPHDIEVRDMSSGISRLEVLGEYIDDIEITPKIGVMDGINAARLIFHRIYFDEDNTEDLRNALSLYSQEWDDKRGQFKSKPKHDWTSHFADAFRYLAVNYNNITEEDDDMGFELSGFDPYG